LVVRTNHPEFLRRYLELRDDLVAVSSVELP
jgi:hypothetical protein